MKSFKEYVLTEEFTDQDFSKIENVLKKYPNERIYMTAKDAPPQSGVVRQDNSFRDKRKPKGLWYSTGDGWFKYIKYEWQKQISNYNKIIKLNLDLSKMLIIDTEEKFLTFDDEYVYKGNELRLQGVDWETISKKYSGIEISPYFPQFRLEKFWYYPWDVASGCIWDFSVIKSFEKIFPQETPVEPKPPEPLSDSESSETTSNGKL